MPVTIKVSLLISALIGRKMTIAMKQIGKKMNIITIIARNRDVGVAPPTVWAIENTGANNRITLNKKPKMHEITAFSFSLEINAINVLNRRQSITIQKKVSMVESGRGFALSKKRLIEGATAKRITHKIGTRRLPMANFTIGRFT